MLKSVSLFTGGMGLDIGIESCGIVSKAYVEKNKACQGTISKNRPGVKIFDNVFNKDILSIKGVDIVVGGPPCQSFSTIGKGRFLKDENGRALLGFVEVVLALRPNVFVLENVPGITRQNNWIVQNLIEKFSRVGYSISYGIVDAYEFGVPQSRRRFLMLGSQGKKIALPEPVEHRTVLRDAIFDLEKCPGDYCTFSKSMLSIMKKIPQGGNWKSLSRTEQDRVMGNANRASGGLCGYYRRPSYDKPSPTLLTSPTQKATTLCHPVAHRPFSVAEYKRIQCFPDDWVVEGSIREQYRQLGNAVPVWLARAIGKAIRSAF